MNIYQFRHNPENVKKAAHLMASPEMRLMLEVLDASAPRFWSDVPIGGSCPPHDHSRMLGRMEGYDIAITYLKAMAVPVPEPAQPIAETYPAPEPTTTKPKRKL